MIIGIPTSISGEKKRYVINQAYADYVIGAKMEPMLIVPGTDLGVVTKICDGLLLPGGIDLDPTFYRENNVASLFVDPDKDRFERDMLYAFLESKKPIFGICRGLQLIAREYMRTNPDVELWMDYWQNVGGHSIVEELSIPRTACSHSVEYLSYLYGEKKRVPRVMYVNSMHHQALVIRQKKWEVDNNLTILARTKMGTPKKDRANGYIIEAFRIRNKDVNVLAVQWHPEELRDYRLIQSFFGVEVPKYITPTETMSKFLESV